MRERIELRLLAAGLVGLAVAMAGGCIHIHLIGGRSQTVNHIWAEQNRTDTAMEAPSDTDVTDTLNPVIPVQVGPDELPGGGGGAPSSPPGSEPGTPNVPAPTPGQPDEPEEPVVVPTDQDLTFLWKPRGENDDKLKILLPHCIDAAVVMAQDQDGVWVPGTLKGRSNDNRQTWTFGDAGDAWTQPDIPVLVVDIEGTELTWTVPAGGERYEEQYDCNEP